MSEINVPFDGNKYMTDKNYFRSVGIGESDDIATAKSIAFVNARTNITHQVKTVTKSVMEMYKNQNRSYNDNLYNELIREVSANVLSNIHNIDDKVYFNDKSNKYQYWVAIEVSKNDVIDYTINKGKQVIKDKEEFTKIYNKEMDDYVNNNSNN